MFNSCISFGHPIGIHVDCSWLQSSNCKAMSGRRCWVLTMRESMLGSPSPTHQPAIKYDQFSYRLHIRMLFDPPYAVGYRRRWTVGATTEMERGTSHVHKSHWALIDYNFFFAHSNSIKWCERTAMNIEHTPTAMKIITNSMQTKRVDERVCVCVVFAALCRMFGTFSFANDIYVFCASSVHTSPIVYAYFSFNYIIISFEMMIFEAFVFSLSKWIILVKRARDWWHIRTTPHSVFVEFWRSDGTCTERWRIFTSFEVHSSWVDGTVT